MAIDVKSTKGSIIVGSLALVCLGAGILIGHLITPKGNGDPLEPSDSPLSEQLVGCDNEIPTKSSDEEYTETHFEEVKVIHDEPVPTITPNPKEKGIERITEDKWIKEKDIIKKLIERIDTKRLRENLRYLSEKPHIAGSDRDVELATYIHDKFQEAGFDSSEMVSYNLLLSKPDSDNPNKVTLNENGIKIFESQHKEQPIHGDDEDPEFIHAFNAYTPAGTVSTEPGVGVVYVNYGRAEDFEQLEELGVNITGHIALVRYGKVYRGNKIRNAEQAGAIGIIIFSDPQDVAPEGIEPKDVYDNSWWLPGTGMQRGSTYLGDGDPLTPGWPSTEHAYRITEEENEDLHKIPSQPIGYADAKIILERLDGDDSPSSWQGGLPGITYKLGPFFKQEFQNVSVTLSTHNSNKIEKSYNVIGIIKGSTEPDRYVMVGNHRDAWGYGASDPSSGTAQLLETARVYGTLLAEGWRPRRSLVFCSWGAEEFGLIGSQEWVEEHIDKLRSRTVAYINTDTCASGPKLQIEASPMLWDVFHNITAMIPAVVNSSKTIFEEWKEYYELLKPEAEEKPIIDGLGSGSDYAPFGVLGGIPAADIWFRRDQVKYNITTYPFYHTGYETFYMVSTFIDPEFKIHQGCGRIASLALKYLADSSIIPYSINRYPKLLMKELLENKNREKLMNIYDKYSELENAVNRYIEGSREFQLKLTNKESYETLELRAVNDQLMKLEQSFIMPEGLPDRPTVKHAVFAPSQFDNYASAGFPGLSDLLYKYTSLEEPERLVRDKKIRRHISDLTIMVDRATSLLKENHLF